MYGLYVWKGRGNAEMIWDYRTILGSLGLGLGVGWEMRKFCYRFSSVLVERMKMENVRVFCRVDNADVCLCVYFFFFLLNFRNSRQILDRTF